MRGNILTFRTAILIGFLLRLFVAIWNGFFGPSFGADTDAAGFHFYAVHYARNIVVDEFSLTLIYPYVLGMVYFLTIDSLFLGSFLSVMVWLASAFILLRIMRLLSIARAYQHQAMFIYAMLPSSILLTSVTLRESYQLLFVNFAVYAVLKIYLRKSATHWFILIISVVGMGMLHGTLFAFGIFIVVTTLLLIALRGHKEIALVKLIFIAPLVTLVVSYGLSLFTEVAYDLDRGIDAAVELIQKGGISYYARAQYRDSVEINGVVGLLLFMPVAFFQYLFEPLPGRSYLVADVELLLENILRAWLIWKAWVGLRIMPSQERRPVLFLFLSYLVIELIWSLGTVNWGTAVRHHIPSMGLLVIAAFASAYPLGKRSRARASGEVLAQ